MSVLSDLIFRVNSPESFSETALKIFRFQADNNPVYKDFISRLGKTKEDINYLSEIPFMPVEFFRDQTVLVGNLSYEKVFESSRTTGTSPARHFIHDLKLYETSFLKTFRLFYGDPSGYLIAALLPSYSERGNSSLIYMTDTLIRKSRNKYSGFYSSNSDKLVKTLLTEKHSENRILLLGVSFALLDLAEKYSPDLSGVIVMETGGMKGRRKEITRMELHEILKQKLNVPVIHSEYGMTELLSQAYSKENGIFNSPPWMKIMIRDPHDPLSITDEPGKSGGINVIDLANLHSCSFIATGDLGKSNNDDSFEVLGRFDNSDIRGCNLMAE